MLSESAILSALSDPAFTDKFPAFTGLKARLDREKVNITRLRKRKGCCGQARVVHGTIVPSFMSIVSNLQGTDLEEFKRYMGVTDLVITTNTNGVQRLKKI